MPPGKRHVDRGGLSMEEVTSIMFRRLTPRRKLQSAAVCKRANCPRPPVAPPAESPSAIEACRTNIKWWESVLNWLQDKHRMIDESLSKDPEDLIVLSSGPEYAMTDCGEYHHPVPRQIIPMKKMHIPGDPQPGGVEIQGVWRPTCSLDRTFYGPNCLPDIKNPSSEDMVIIKEFFCSHQKSMVKHYDHLIYLQDIIFVHLIPQVRSKIRELIKELKLLQNPDLKVSERFFFSDIDPEEESVDYIAPETEEDYPEQSDEEDEDTIMMGKLSLGGP